MAHIPAIDLNLFVVLDAIYSEGSVTRAGEKLGLTQPAVSHALTRLRALFGDALFVRQGQAMIPTPLARRVIEPVRQSLRTLASALDETGSFDPVKAQRRFTISVRDILEATALPRLVEQVYELAPGIEIAGVRVERRDLESALAAGQVDAAVDVLLPASPNLRQQVLTLDQLVVIVRRGHPRVNAAIDLPTYLKASHVLVSSRRRGTGEEDVALAKLGLERRIRVRCQSYFAACRIVAKTDLLVTMPERYARVLAGDTSNQILPMPVEISPITIHLYWHAAFDSDPTNRWLRARIVDAFAEDPGATGSPSVRPSQPQRPRAARRATRKSRSARPGTSPRG